MKKKHINYTYTGILKPSVMALTFDLTGFTINCTNTIYCVIKQAYMLICPLFKT